MLSAKPPKELMLNPNSDSAMDKPKAKETPTAAVMALPPRPSNLLLKATLAMPTNKTRKMKKSNTEE